MPWQGKTFVVLTLFKTCASCRVEKPISDFHRQIISSDGLRSKCKSCRVSESRAYWEANQEVMRQKGRARYWSDPEAARKARRDWCEANVVLVKESKRRDYLAHADSYKARVKKWVELNPDRRLANARAYVERYPERRRLTVVISSSKRRAAIQAAARVITTEQLQAKIHYWNDACWLCGADWEQIDHVKPLSKGGSHILANLRPVCARCNYRKHARWPMKEVLAMAQESTAS